jgi:hypothetical protein
VTLETVTPRERAVAADRLEALVEARLTDVAWQFEQRWDGLPESVRDWLREILMSVLRDIGRDVLAVARDLH